MALEDVLSGWTGPSSATEKDKQDRTERMIRDAINSHPAFKGYLPKVYAKGSYANETNVRADSDVDIAVECTEVVYWENAPNCTHTVKPEYKGNWTPAKLRAELIAALEEKFDEQVDSSGSTAIQINSSSARVDADVVPCFTYRYYWSDTNHVDGTKVFKTDGSSVINYPAQQLANGREKNKRTNHSYKKGARILKRLENAMAEDDVFRELPSYFMECLAYRCPDSVYGASTWTEVVKGMLRHIWNELQGDEPTTNRWLEVNERIFLFHGGQKWTRADGREFAQAAWTYLGFA